jgi:16S rRNA (cytosine967-C5)-methyltransferase
VARRAALALLRAVRGGERFSEARDRCLAALDTRDRRLAHELSAGVLRRQADLDRSIDLSRADRRLHDVLRLGAYQLRFLTRVPAHAAVSTSVDLARAEAGDSAAGYVNQALRRIAGARRQVSGAGKSHPEWLVRRWAAQFGAADAERLIAWNDTRPVLTLQPVRWGVETLARRLEQEGVHTVTAPFGAGLRPVTPTPDTRHLAPRDLPGYAAGAFIVQDPVHALICRYAAIPRGRLVYDACASPGGKAVMLERLGARVLAGEVRRDRIPRLADTVRRAGVAIHVCAADLLAAPLPPDGADAVLVDAPCSATGTIARHPDARWRLRPRVIARAATRQRALLDAAAGLVRPGGVLIYATCSLEPEENEAIVTDFLTRRSAFGRAPVPDAAPAALLTSDGDLLALPHRHGVDGAYAARLVRSH